MTSETTYNGWTNYETWAANLWLDNDEGTQRYWQERAQEIWNETWPEVYANREQAATYALAEAIKDMVEEQAPEVEGMYGDLLTAALGSVDWREIAEHHIADIDKTEESDAA